MFIYAKVWIERFCLLVIYSRYRGRSRTDKCVTTMIDWWWLCDYDGRL